MRIATCKPRLIERRRGVSLLGLLTLLVLLVGAIAGGIYVWQRGEADPDGDAITHKVVRENFLLTVTERGEIESGDVTEIQSRVKTKNTPGVAILRLVDEGTHVKSGDFLVELDASAFQEEKTSQQIIVNTSHALEVEAKNIYETAVIAKREYLEGTFVQEQQTIESEVFVAEENLNRAKEYYEYSKKLAAKGYVNDLQLEADKFAVEKSEKELDAAETKLRVLRDFTKEKMLKQFESDIVIAKAKWEAEQNSHALEVQKLEEIEDQITNCTIVSPKAGVVTYAHERDHRGNDEFVVKLGAIVRERQTIFKLPDATSMRVELTINESLIQHVRPGMAAKIRPVGLGNQVFLGNVQSVNRYAEPSGWRKANVKEYKAYVSVDGPREQPVGKQATTRDAPRRELRSGLTASVTIECMRRDQVLLAPVQSVLRHGKKFFCIVRAGNDWQAKEVQVGPTDDKSFVILSGLKEAERVSMNPKRYRNRVALPELPSTPNDRGSRPDDKPESNVATGDKLSTDQTPGSSRS